MLRRDTLRYLAMGSITLISGLLKPISVLAKWNKAAFSSVDFDEAIVAYFPGQEIDESEQINIGVHSIVENGAVVPVKVKTDLPNIESITIFVEKNPNPLIASFNFTTNCVGFISTRIKMQNSSNIIAVVKSEGALFSTRKFIEVHEGGCG
ncbi:thiosulfate oxidation carrier protein SoxY [Gammaproteobacteria bacterium]|jgi:sulfur-oxidizing protein SoxY|nr:thiosulfate oxidation carrier protein SoxY [Gammaproteobacteria bacterium]|tara:strand:- start:60 stop:512 length:453 start_codon:yes stop_codon:yes gene_type:complete